MIEKYDEITNRKIRVFISSTFKDMHQEREIIVNKVFPRLRKELKDRMIEICEIDLRWGIPESASNDGRVLEICIGEVLKCNPFFVGLIGNRYGYVPEDLYIKNLPLEMRKSLGAGRLSGVSITELEIRAGVFAPETKVYASLHIKDCFDMSLCDNPDRMKDLLERIKRFRRCKEYQYKSMEDLEEQVYASLYAYINDIFPAKYEYPYNDTDYYSHLNLLKNCNAKYMPDYDFIYNLTDAIDESTQLVIKGRKGTGKTSTISYMIKSYGVDEDYDVFFHYVSLEGDNNTIQKLYYRLFLFLNYQYDLKINYSENITETQIQQVLSNVKLNRTLYIFIDAVDKLLGNRNYPVQIGNLCNVNKNVKVIYTCTDDRSFDAEKIIGMPDLTDEQIEAIVEVQFRQFGKKIDGHKIRDICNNSMCHNPLFLSILINELRVYGSYDDFNAFFEKVVVMDTVGGLFKFVFDRLCDFLYQNNYETIYVYQVFSLLLCTKNGISESEIFSITKMPPIIWVIIYSSLERFLFESNGVLSLNHDLVRFEMENILLDAQNDSDYSKWARNAIIAAFEKVDNISRKAVELSHQYYVGKDYDRLLKHLSALPVFRYLFENEYYTLIMYFNCLQAYQGQLTAYFTDNAAGYMAQAARLCSVLCQSGCFQACIDIGNFFIKNTDSPEIEISILSDMARSEYKLNSDRYFTASKRYEALIQKYSALYPEDEVGINEHLFKYAIVCSSKGEIDKAIGIYEKVVDTYRENGIYDMLSSWAMGNLANCYYSLGFQSKGESLFNDAINTRIQIFGKCSPEVAWEYCYFWPNLYSEFKVKEAMDMVAEAKDIYGCVFNNTGLELAWAIQNYANMLSVYGEYEEAISNYNISIEMNDAVIEKSRRPHVYSLTAYNNKANAYFLQGDNEKAKQQLETAYKYKLLYNGENHPYTINTIINLANITRDINASIPLYEKGIQALDKSYHLNSIDSYFIYVCMGICCLNNNLDKEAYNCLKTAYSIRRSQNFDITIIDYLLENAAQKAGLAISLDLADVTDLPLKLYLTHNNESEMIIIPEIVQTGR